MEATMERWEENEEVGLRGRQPRQNNTTTTTSVEEVVYSSHTFCEAEEDREEAEGIPRNGFHLVSDENEGTESPYEISEFKVGDVDFFVSEKSSGDEIVASEVESLSFQKSVEAKHQDEDYIKLKDEELAGVGSLLLPSEESIEQNGRYASLENGKAEDGEVKLRDVSEERVVSELYLDKVYQKPAAHEFYCPNCKSCITKVLIRGRESEDIPETVPIPEPIDTVRCTSCFSFLIPAGNWFFPRSVAKENENQTDQGINIEDNVGASVPVQEYNSTIQEQNNQVPMVGMEPLPIESVGPSSNKFDSRIGVELPVSPQDSNGTAYDKSSPTLAQSVGISRVVSVGKTPEPYQVSRVGVELPDSPQDSNGTSYDKRPERSAQPVGISEAVSVDKAPKPYLDSRIGVELPVSPQDSNGTSYDQNIPMLAQSVEITETSLNDKASVPGDFVEGVLLPVPSYDSYGTLHDQKSPLPGQPAVSITVSTQPPAPRIDDEGPAESKPRETTVTIISGGLQPIISETRDTKTIEILKSIVYGGLTEAIASVSIVTSAASAGTATLNILALALANLLGGLFIIGHHLWELKVDQSRVTSNETNEEVDRYQEVLGRRENFFLHASVAILSFLIFGLVPPLVYCFSFRQSNDMDLKLAVVAASSLLCIILLATGKAYIQTPRKYIKTLIYYVIIGVGVAGVSYLAGDLIEKLIEKLGWFDSTVAGTLPLPETSIVKLGTLPLPQMSIVKPAWKSW